MKAIDEKLRNMMLAHLDGIYKFSARADCDELVTQLINLCTRPPAPQVSAEVAEALRILVGLKEHKESAGKTLWYEREAPVAWAKAKAALATIQQGGSQ